jgi:CDP-glycerol glycerophosphotransferase (TagB/SpsB family)
MDNLVEKLSFMIWRVMGYIIPKRADFIVLSTYPDFDDTFGALQQALKCSDKRLIILTRRTHVPPAGACDASTTVVAAKSFRGIWYYHRAKTILFTHGLFSRWAPHDWQLVINLWHGTPIKNIALLDGKSRQEVPKSHYVLAESDAYRTIMATAFGVAEQQVLVATHPRIDMLRSRKTAKIRERHPEKSIVAWLPTYRKSTTGDIREDGSPEKDILSGHFDTAQLDRVLEENNAICVVKPHPMADFPPGIFAQSKNIILLQNADLADENMTVYEFLSKTDLLVTDLSSVYFDYDMIGKPSLVFFPDRTEYAAGRGFVRPLEDVLRHGFVEDSDAFISALVTKLGQINHNEQVFEDPHSDHDQFSVAFLGMVEVLHERGRGSS